MRRAISFAIYVPCDDGRPRLGGAVALLVFARRTAGFLLRFELRQSKLRPHMIAACNRVIARKAMHHEAIRCCIVDLDRQRTIFGTVSWPRHERFSAGYVAAHDLCDPVDWRQDR